MAGQRLGRVNGDAILMEQPEQKALRRQGGIKQFVIFHRIEQEARLHPVIVFPWAFGMTFRRIA